MVHFKLPLVVNVSMVALAAVASTARACELKIGATGPLSGAAAQWGQAIKGAADFVAAEANKQGGVEVGGQRCKVSVIAIDAKYTAEGAAAAANNFVSQNVKFILGPIGAPEVTGMKPVTTRNKIMLLSDSYAKDAIGPRWPLTFHVGPGPLAWGDPIVKLAKEKFGIKKVLTIAPNDQAGTDTAEAAITVYKKNGVEASAEYYQRGTTNFAPIITRIMNANPDSVDTVSTPPGDAGIVVKQLRQAGFKGVIGRLGGPGTEEIFRISGGKDVVKNFYWFEPVYIDDNVKKLGDSYRELVGSAPPENNFFYLFAAGGRAMLKAISQSGATDDAEKAAEALRKMTIEDANLGKGLWIGQEAYGINQELSLPFGVGLLIDGKEQPAVRIEAPDGK